MAATLFTYMQQTQRFMRDQRQELLNPGDLVSYINRARREIAMRSQSIRMLTPISGSIASVSITAVGSGYTGATLALSAPDFPSGGVTNPTGLQATVSLTVASGTVSAATITQVGAGYFSPTYSVTGNGTGATVSLTVGGVNKLVAGQEQYNFSSVSVASLPGADVIHMIRSLSILYSNFRYSLPLYPFSEYQAKIRNYPFQYQWVPAFASQFGQGASGSFFVYPIPSQAYQIEFDCSIIPADLTTDLSTEALPSPWVEAVPYFAAHLSFLELQNYNAAKFYLDLFDQFVNRYGTYARPGRVSNIYGRYLWPFVLGSFELFRQGVGGFLG